MNVTQIRCGGCGAPISFSGGARLVTCRFCNATLSIEQTESLKTPAQPRAEASPRLRWRKSKRRKGNPSFLAAIFALLLGVPFSFFWIIGAVTSGAPLLYTVLGIAFLLLLVTVAVRSMLSATRHPTA